MIHFLGLGAQKSGTSWVYSCLYEHPEICIPIKEIHFFSRPRFEKGLDWYESHFQKCDSKKLCGEFSTSYLYSKEAPQRIFNLYPKAKLIAILRNPVERALSQYRNSIKAGEITEETSFEEFVLQEESVVGQGAYYEQLERYLTLFPKEQLLILIYEDSKKDPESFMKKIYEFLSVDTEFKASMLHTEVNVARTPKSVALGRVMHHSAEFLRKIGLHGFVHAIRKMGLPNFIHSLNSKVENPIETIQTKDFSKLFKNDVGKLSVLLQRDMAREWNI